MCDLKICLCGTQYRIWPKMRRRRLKMLLIFVCCLLTILLFILLTTFNVTANLPSHCASIDVVFTWVNGSDANFIKLATEFGGSNYDPARFDDKNELKYSLRSLERFAPWVNHVYIVTNQIPQWLDLSYERVSVVPHELIVPNLELLPTFSSAAIETFLHRIPKLSKRFLYLNDDIFLGAPLYPEDLYTDSEGVQIYQAWMVPDCADDCPWTYIGDGACDLHCNIAECQYDGGDCVSSADHTVTEHAVRMDAQLNNLTTSIHRFPINRNLRKHKKHTSFREYMRHRNLTTMNELQKLVDNFNKELNFENGNIEPAATRSSKTEKHNEVTPSSQKHSTKDTYSQSLIYTNRLLNRRYGFKARNVLAHVGFLLDRDIIEAMQAKFADEVLVTASHRFRAINDLQFAFAYYTFLMSEQTQLSVDKLFDDFDTDQSGTWSDREVRTFMTRMFPLVDWPAMHFFEEVISNCSRIISEDQQDAKEIVYSTLAYERYEDSNLPTITRELVTKCPLLADAMHTNLGTRSKYKYKTTAKRLAHNNFMMLTSNVSEVTYGLDKLRRNPRKFNCINDNLDPNQIEDNALIRNLLEDFYISFFPRRSKFELPSHYRNRFTNWQDYMRWRLRKRAALVLGYSSTFLLLFFLLRFVCLHKAKFVRRCIHRVIKI